MPTGSPRDLDAHLERYVSEGRAYVDALPAVSDVLQFKDFSERRFVGEELSTGPRGNPLSVTLTYDVVAPALPQLVDLRRALLDAHVIATTNIIKRPKHAPPTDPVSLKLGFFQNRVMLVLNLK